MAVKRCCLTALRQCSGGRFFLLFRPRAFGKARAQCCMQTRPADIPSSTARPFSASRRLPVTCESRRIGGQMIYVRFGMWIEPTRPKNLNSFMSMQMLTAARCFSPICSTATIWAIFILILSNCEDGEGGLGKSGWTNFPSQLRIFKVLVTKNLVFLVERTK